MLFLFGIWKDLIHHKNGSKSNKQQDNADPNTYFSFSIVCYCSIFALFIVLFWSLDDADWPELKNIDGLLSWNGRVNVFDIGTNVISKLVELNRRPIRQLLVVRHRSHI